jgi:restriction endonuclease S subunit
VAIIRIDRKKISPEYIFLALTSKLGQKQLFGSKTQTATVAHLSPALIKKILVPKIDDIAQKEIEDNFVKYVETVRKTENTFDEISASFG